MPFINNEGSLFFSSDGHVGLGLLDIFGTVADESGAIDPYSTVGHRPGQRAGKCQRSDAIHQAHGRLCRPLSTGNRLGLLSALSQ